MQKGILFVGLFSVAAIGSSVAACSSTTTSSNPEPAADAGKEGGASGSSGSSGSSGTSGSSGDTDSGANPDQACGAEATQQGCAQCCATNHPSGYKTFTEALLGCACQGTGADGGTPPCSAECGTTACATPQASATPACNTCLQSSVSQTGACQAPVSTACTANADCLAQQKCVPLCQNKP